MVWAALIRFYLGLKIKKATVAKNPWLEESGLTYESDLWMKFQLFVTLKFDNRKIWMKIFQWFSLSADSFNCRVTYWNIEQVT